MALTILEGSTFCICDERGDLDGETCGLFADDTRSLPRQGERGGRPDATGRAGDYGRRSLQAGH